MTEVGKMTDQQLNRALAELMGYRIEHVGYSGEVSGVPHLSRLINPNGGKVDTFLYADNAWMFAPYYCADPAASLEVQAAAIAKNEEGYVQRLADVVGANCFWDGMYGDMAPTGIAWLLSATPRQRAEAAYMTLSE